MIGLPLLLLHAEEKSPEKDIFTIPPNKSYMEPWQEREPGVRTVPPRGARREATRNGLQMKILVSPESEIVWYPLVHKSEYELFLELSLPEGEESKIKINISSPEDTEFKPIEKELDIKGTDELVKTGLGKLDVKKTAYYRIGIEPLKKSGDYFVQVANLLFEAPNGTGANAHATQFLTSPSVHLWHSVGDGVKREFDWLYGEIQVPEGYDPMYTYYMCIGFCRGYFGIQVNHETERRVLFSIWDSSNEAVDRAKVPDEDRVQLVGKGEGIYSGSFGNEGTGGQSYWKYDWKTGDVVRFIMNARRLPNEHVVYSAWFMDKEEEGWKYMASWIAPKEKRLLDGFYSFLENFGQGNGQEPRMAYYMNFWGKELGKDWLELNHANVTHTDGKPDGRRDYEGGKALDGSNRHYMKSGGYTAPKDQKRSELEKTRKAPDVDLDAFIKVIDEGLEKFNESKK